MALQGANAERRSGWAPSLAIRGGKSGMLPRTAAATPYAKGARRMSSEQITPPPPGD